MAPGTSSSSTTSDWGVRYWRCGGTSTSSTTAGDWYAEMEYDSTSTSSNYSWTPYPRVVQKRVIVKPPEHWTKAIVDLFVRLVNDDTKTGWKVTALLRGVEIVDPFIDVREMADFIGLLKAQASAADCKTIDGFFKKHGLDGAPKKPKKSTTKSKK